MNGLVIKLVNCQPFNSGNEPKRGEKVYFVVNTKQAF